MILGTLERKTSNGKGEGEGVGWNKSVDLQAVLIWTKSRCQQTSSLYISQHTRKNVGKHVSPRIGVFEFIFVILASLIIVCRMQDGQQPTVSLTLEMKHNSSAERRYSNILGVLYRLGARISRQKGPRVVMLLLASTM